MDSTAQVAEEDRSSIQSRTKWGSKLQFLLSVLGMSVGFGNIWRFPYVCMKNGGGAFLIPYVLAVLFMGIPLYFLELSLGQFTGKSFKDVWSYCPVVQGIGIGFQMTLVFFTCFYVMLFAWTLYYLYYSFYNPLPWSTCDNEWNTPYCFSATEMELTNFINLHKNGTEDNSHHQFINACHNTSNIRTTYPETSKITAVNHLCNLSSFINENTLSTLNASQVHIWHGHSAAEEFWQYKILDISSGLDNIGSINGNVVVCMAVSWALVCLCVSKGIRTSGKVVYVTATLPYLLLSILLVHTLTLPGSVDGVMFFVRPDFSSLTNIQVWLDAGIQVFFSFALGGGVIITLSSFNTFYNDCLRDAYILTIASEATSVFGGFIIFSAFGFMAHQANVPITEVAKSGPGLGFVAYPLAVSQMPLSNVWAVLFFMTMVTLGLDSMFGLVEAEFDYFEACFSFMKKRQTISRIVLSSICVLISLPFCTQGGVYLFQLADWYVYAFAPMFFTLIECITVAWIYGAERFSADVELMIGRRVPGYIKFCWRFLSPLLLVVMMTAVFVSYVPPTYGKYVYPEWVSGAGWIYATLPVLPFIAVGLKVVYESPGKTAFQKLRRSTNPTPDWKPAENEVDYRVILSEEQGNFRQRLLANLGCFSRLQQWQAFQDGRYLKILSTMLKFRYPPFHLNILRDILP
ncbi:sodium- and chloride-dependent GABA transporter 1-like [Ylistrum balloti]|uniref:sodium- and chloride-dependent GABA transporter 1-like n=1 Tax=Ylistrum balloti TaxID=509963 RepID=UPI002905B86B|nr:sodium- and chloride-dependent GABA transporter 1-like [Ylistrum balloti]